MPTPAKRSNSKSLANYDTLLRRVKETLILGHQKIEEQKVRTYWETGELILTHTLYYKDRAAYGQQVLDRLGDDLGMDESLLRRCVKFRTQYPRLPIQARGPEFSWSHYRKLITVADPKERVLLEEKIIRNKWSAKEFEVHLKSQALEHQPQATPSDAKQLTKPLTPLRGKLYTYQIVQRPTLGTGEDAAGLLVDLGFGIYRDVGAHSRAPLRDRDIIQSVKRDSGYRLTKIDATAKDLYTYNAFVERVVDGDTLKVRLDLGFNTWIRHTLRLRGIDCPEMDTNEGQAAKTFVQSYIKEAQQIIVRSSRSDKYDRYLADVFIPGPEKTADVFLNNLLLELGHAQRMD